MSNKRTYTKLWLPHFVSGRDVDYVYMMDTNNELLPDLWEPTPASQAMALLIIIPCEHVTSLTSSNS